MTQPKNTSDPVRHLIHAGRMAIVGSLWLLVPASSLSQSDPPTLPDNSKDGGGNIVGVVSLLSDREFWLAVIVVLFSTFTVYFLYRLFNNPDLNIEAITRTYTVIMIVLGTLFLISAGFSNENIAPALGLFGTIAGYLLGRSDRRAGRKRKVQPGESK